MSQRLLNDIEIAKENNDADDFPDVLWEIHDMIDLHRRNVRFMV